MNLNRVLLAGRLTRDPELRYTPKGSAVAKLSLGVNRTYKSDAGEKKEEVCFVDIDVWGKQAETVSQYFKKGSPIFVEGRLKLDSWDDKQSGQKKTKLCVVMESFQFVGSKQEATAQPAVPPGSQAASPVASGNDAPPPEHDDVPF